VQLAKRAGARVIATVGTDEKVALARGAGADEVVVYTRDNFTTAARAFTGGRGVDVVYDPVGDRYTEPCVRSLAPGGRLLVVGFAAGQIPSLPLNLALLKGASIVGVFWGDFTRREPGKNAEGMKEMFGWLQSGKLRPHVSGRYTLEQTVQALNDMSARKVTGKILIVP
jgi:NADPH2:quinone reductase